MEIIHQSTKHSKRQERKRFDLGTMVYGKVPPQAKDLESAILGAIMLEKRAFDQVIEILTPECFYVEAHQRIFESMNTLQAKGQPIDLLTVCEELRRCEAMDIVGGPYFITKLTDSVVSSAHIEAHCRIVLQKFIQRELIRISGETMQAAYEDSTDAFDLLDEAEAQLFGISSANLKSDYKALSDGLPEMVQRLEFLQTQTGSVTGITTGFPKLDGVTCGWQNEDLIILAARPSVGKTAFALNLADNASSAMIPTGYFSLEMGMQSLLRRVVSMGSGIRMQKLTTGRLEGNEMQRILSHGGEMSDVKKKAPVYVDDTAALTLFELRAKARRMVNKHKVGMIIIDYLQLMSGGKETRGNREQEISTISRGLKALAKDLKIPVIALSQLSRAVEGRGKGLKIPQLSDLRESGAIEQDADMVIFLYRPDEEERAEDAELRDRVMVGIKKHRNGALEDFAFSVDNSIQKWTEIGLLNTRPWQQPDNLRKVDLSYTRSPLPSEFDEDPPF